MEHEDFGLASQASYISTSSYSCFLGQISLIFYYTHYFSFEHAVRYSMYIIFSLDLICSILCIFIFLSMKIKICIYYFVHCLLLRQRRSVIYIYFRTRNVLLLDVRQRD